MAVQLFGYGVIHYVYQTPLHEAKRDVYLQQLQDSNQPRQIIRAVRVGESLVWYGWSMIGLGSIGILTTLAFSKSQRSVL